MGHMAPRMRIRCPGAPVVAVRAVSRWRTAPACEFLCSTHAVWLEQGFRGWGMFRRRLGRLLMCCHLIAPVAHSSRCRVAGARCALAWIAAHAWHQVCQSCLLLWAHKLGSGRWCPGASGQHAARSAYQLLASWASDPGAAGLLPETGGDRQAVFGRRLLERCFDQSVDMVVCAFRRPAMCIFFIFAVVIRCWQLSSVYRGMQCEYKPGLCSSCC